MRAGRASYPLIVSFIALTPYVEGCGGSSDNQNPDGPRTVQGSSKTAFVTDSGEMEQANDLSSFQISAFVMENGSFREITTSGQADGSFSIANVPGGSYWLKFVDPNSKIHPPAYFYTDSTNPDLGYRRLERPGLVFARNPTLVSMSLTGLIPWSGNCILETQVPTQSTRWLAASPFVSSGNDGATALTVDTTVEGSTETSPALLDPALGDKLTVLQICTSSGDPNNLTVQKYGTVTPPKMVDGQVASVSIAMMDVPQNQTLKAKFRRSAYAALASSVSPELQPSAASMTLSAYPTPGDKTNGSGDRLSELVNYTATGMTDLDLNLSYGNPNPTAWFLQIDFRADLQTMRTAPGQLTPSSVGGFLRSAYAAPSGAMSAAVDGGPIVSPPKGVQIAGMDANSAHSGVGLNPTLSWSAPATGTADLYTVSVYAFDAISTAWRVSSQLYTSATSITVPPGVLQASGAYVFRVDATSRGGSLGAAPFRLAFPYGNASYVSAVMQVN